jgi:urea transport system ATP-binding protein
MALEVEGLDVAYGRTAVLFDVSLAVPGDGMVCVMGRNGVGKSTLLNTIMGILRPTSGRILLDGRDITTLRPDQRVHAGIAYVPAGRACFPQLTVMENLRVVAEATPGGGAALDEVLELFPRLQPMLDRWAGFLSGGQNQQLAMARALVTRPRYLLLDEPTEGIQPSIILEIEDVIAKLNATSGLAILLVEQYMEFALRIASRYVVIDAGRVAASGETAGFNPAAVQHLLGV